MTLYPNSSYIRLRYQDQEGRDLSNALCSPALPDESFPIIRAAFDSSLPWNETFSEFHIASRDLTVPLGRPGEDHSWLKIWKLSLCRGVDTIKISFRCKYDEPCSQSSQEAEEWEQEFWQNSTRRRYSDVVLPRSDSPDMSLERSLSI
jgi:hypothetical protein